MGSDHFIMKILFFVLVLSLSLLFNHCEVKSKREISVNDTIYTDGKGLELEDKIPESELNCLNLLEEKVCIINRWKILAHKEAYLFCSIDSNSDSFFAIVKINKKIVEVDSKTYLRSGYSQLIGDTHELSRGYTLYHLFFNKKETYYGEYFTVIDTINYLSYSMVYENEDNLYELVLKAKEESHEYYYTVFQNIIYTFKINDKQLFDPNDKLKKFIDVDLTKI